VNLHSPSDPGFIANPPSTDTNIKFTILSPAKYSFWKPSEIMEIRWTVSGSVEKVDIQLFRKSAFQISLINNLENIGSYKWHIPNNIDQSLHYHIKIINHFNPEEYKLSDSFAIKD
jgi:hypothetical protein